MRLEDEIKQNIPFKTAKDRAIVNLLFTTNWLVALQKQTFKPYGITLQQFNVLRIFFQPRMFAHVQVAFRLDEKVGKQIHAWFHRIFFKVGHALFGQNLLINKKVARTVPRRSG